MSKYDPASRTRGKRNRRRPSADEESRGAYREIWSRRVPGILSGEKTSAEPMVLPDLVGGVPGCHKCIRNVIIVGEINLCHVAYRLDNKLNDDLLFTNLDLPLLLMSIRGTRLSLRLLSGATIEIFKWREPISDVRYVNSFTLKLIFLIID